MTESASTGSEAAPAFEGRTALLASALSVSLWLGLALFAAAWAVYPWGDKLLHWSLLFLAFLLAVPGFCDARLAGRLPATRLVRTAWVIWAVFAVLAPLILLVAFLLGPAGELVVMGAAAALCLVGTFGTRLYRRDSNRRVKAWLQGEGIAPTAPPIVYACLTILTVPPSPWPWTAFYGAAAVTALTIGVLAAAWPLGRHWRRVAVSTGATPTPAEIRVAFFSASLRWLRANSVQAVSMLVAGLLVAALFPSQIHSREALRLMYPLGVVAPIAAAFLAQIFLVRLQRPSPPLPNIEASLDSP